MTDLTVFNSSEFGAIRTTCINGVVYFVGKDVAEALGYSNTRDALYKHVKPNHKTDGVAIRDAIGREQNPTLIDEAGLYSLVMRAKTEKAEAFQEWVTSEVLPAIHKHGGYLTPEKLKEVLDDPDVIIELATRLKEERLKVKELQGVCDFQAQQIAEFKPIKEYYDIILESNDTLLISQIAADYGLSAVKLNRILHEEKVVYNSNGQWLLYQELRNKGYTKSKTFNFLHGDGSHESRLHTVWTQKGRLKIHEILTRRGIKANIDKG